MSLLPLPTAQTLNPIISFAISASYPFCIEVILAAIIISAFCIRFMNISFSSLKANWKEGPVIVKTNFLFFLP